MDGSQNKLSEETNGIKCNDIDNEILKELKDLNNRNSLKDAKRLEHKTLKRAYKIFKEILILTTVAFVLTLCILKIFTGQI